VPRGSEAAASAVRRLVPTADPYWAERDAVLFEDPDGWVMSLAPWVFGEEPAPAG
jgi:hypothetical protein